MRHPKHRTTIYVITREYYDSFQEVSTFTCLDSFRSLERAEEVAEAYRKEAQEKSLTQDFTFEVMASTYYDL